MRKFSDFCEDLDPVQHQLNQARFKLIAAMKPAVDAALEMHQGDPQKALAEIMASVKARLAEPPPQQGLTQR